MVKALSHCNVCLQFGVEASASTAASSKLPVIVTTKSTLYYFLCQLDSSIDEHTLKIL